MIFEMKQFWNLLRFFVYHQLIGEATTDLTVDPQEFPLS